MAKCKITVLKKIFNEELVNDFCSLDLPDNCKGCPRFKIGDKFIVENHNDAPEGFCSWAWADIHKDVLTVLFNGSYPWINQKGVSIACCTDGLMPVIFKLERIEA